MITAATSAYHYASLEMDPDKVIALTKSLTDQGVGYGLDYKAHPLSCQAPHFVGQNGQTGHVAPLVDCSGDHRWVAYHALGQPADFSMPDGSENILDWYRSQGFKTSDYASALLEDGAIRAGVLLASDTPEKIGHIVYAINGRTYESHGHAGPSSRVVSELDFCRKMHWIVVRPGK